MLRVIPPTQAEIDADVEAEREEQLKEEKEKQVWSLNPKMLIWTFSIDSVLEPI